MKWSQETDLITTAALNHGLDPLLIMAIRRAEHGQPGREFGVLSIPAPNYTRQLDVCCNTVRTALTAQTINPLGAFEHSGRHTRLKYTDNFISCLGRTYAPPAARNDPKNLNANWTRNVTTFYLALLTLTPGSNTFTDL